MDKRRMKINHQIIKWKKKATDVPFLRARYFEQLIQNPKHSIKLCQNYRKKKCVTYSYSNHDRHSFKQIKHGCSSFRVRRMLVKEGSSILLCGSRSDSDRASEKRNDDGDDFTPVLTSIPDTKKKKVYWNS